MAQAGNGGSGHEQSIGSPSDTPVDGIAGSNPGTQQPAGADVNAGVSRNGARSGARHGTSHGDPGREDGKEQVPGQSAQSPTPQRRTGSFASTRQSRPVAPAREDMGTLGSQGAGSAYEGGSGDTVQDGAASRGQRIDDPAHAGAPGGTLQRGTLVQTGSRGN